jgi:hypothetical protein
MHNRTIRPNSTGINRILISGMQVGVPEGGTQRALRLPQGRPRLRGTPDRRLLGRHARLLGAVLPDGSSSSPGPV